MGVSVVSTAREGLANAELLDYMSKVLAVTKAQMRLERGWSAQSKYLLLSGLKAVDVFKRLKAGVDTADALIPTSLPLTWPRPFRRRPRATPTTRRARPQVGEEVEANEEELLADHDLAEAPSLKRQTFIK